MHAGHVILEIVSPGKLGLALVALEDALVRVIAQMCAQRVLAESLGTQWTREQLVLADGAVVACVKESMVEQIRFVVGTEAALIAAPGRSSCSRCRSRCRR